MAAAANSGKVNVTIPSNFDSLVKDRDGDADKKHNVYNILIEKKIALVARSKLDLKKKLKLLIKDSKLREELSLNSSKTFKSDNKKFVIKYFNSIYKNANN